MDLLPLELLEEVGNYLDKASFLVFCEAVPVVDNDMFYKDAWRRRKYTVEDCVKYDELDLFQAQYISNDYGYYLEIGAEHKPPNILRWLINHNDRITLPRHDFKFVFREFAIHNVQEDIVELAVSKLVVERARDNDDARDLVKYLFKRGKEDARDYSPVIIKLIEGSQHEYQLNSLMGLSLRYDNFACFKYVLENPDYEYDVYDSGDLYNEFNFGVSRNDCVDLLSYTINKCDIEYVEEVLKYVDPEPGDILDLIESTKLRDSKIDKVAELLIDCPGYGFKKHISHRRDFFIYYLSKLCLSMHKTMPFMPYKMLFWTVLLICSGVFGILFGMIVSSSSMIKKLVNLGGMLVTGPLLGLWILGGVDVFSTITKAPVVFLIKERRGFPDVCIDPATTL